MLKIKNIDKLVGHEFIMSDSNWQVVSVVSDIDYPKTYSIQLARFNMIYDPMTFNPHKRMVENGAILLERTQKNGGYKMWNSKHKLSHLALDISLMDTMDKLIKAIEFIL
jgi:hypothetical protein